MNKTDEIIYGRNAVIEAIKSGMPINKILISSGEISGSLKIILNFAKERGIPCQISLEERMGCGVGACLVCACKIKKADGEEAYLHVCKDGPVFNAEEVVF